MMRLLPSRSSAKPHHFYPYGYPLALHALITLSSSHLSNAAPSAASASRTTIFAAAMTTQAQQQPRPPSSTPHSTSRRLARTIVEVISGGAKTLDTKESSIAAPARRPPPPPRICLAIAGGGSGSISSLASTPGASVSLVEGRVLYDRNSFADFLGTYRSRKDGGSVSSSSSSTSYVSSDAAVDLARCALHRCMRCTSRISTAISAVDGGEGVTVESGMDTCVGVGCTSALATTRPRRGEHVCHVALADTSSGTVSLHDCVLTKGARDRWEEEEVVSSVVLLSILRYLREGMDVEGGDVLGKTITSATGEILRDGEVIEEETLVLPARVVRGSRDEGDGVLHAATSTDGDADDAPPHSPPSSVPSMAGAREGAERVIRGEERAVMVVPTVLRRVGDVVGSRRSDGARIVSMTALSAHPVLPADTIVFPGSFNPPHRGHVALANAAADALRRIRREESATHGSDDDDGGDSSSLPVSVVFEMSLTNADKPPMEADEAVRRLSNFASMAVDPSSPDGGADDGVAMPDDWAVLLTAAPLFSEKVDILADCVSGADPMRSSRRLAFVIGTDTMVRILNPKYYEGKTQDAMMEAVRDMGRRGVHFIVGGRLEQGGDGGSDKFVSGSEEWSSLPPDVRDMFTLLSEDEFRADVSSTELRRKAAAAAMAEKGVSEKR